MPSTLLTAATDICVIAGVAAVATAAINSKIAPFTISLGAEYDDDSLVAAEPNDAVATPGQPRSPLQQYADDDDKKALTVTVTEVAVTPPLAEMEGVATKASLQISSRNALAKHGVHHFGFEAFAWSEVAGFLAGLHEKSRSPNALCEDKACTDTFRIPDTDLILKFESFGPILDISDLRTLLTEAQDDIQTDITRRGADATVPFQIYSPWWSRGIALQLHILSRAATLGQLRSLMEGLELYLVKPWRARATRFRVWEETSDWSVVLVVGEIWAT